DPRGEFCAYGRMRRAIGQGALVVMLSAMVSPRALQRAVTIAERGLTTLVIDCLADASTENAPNDTYLGIAWRIRVLERDREIRLVREAGIPVVPWMGPGSLDV